MSTVGKLLSKARSKSKERTMEKSESSTKPEITGASAIEQLPPDQSTTTIMSQATKKATNRKIQKMPDELLELAELAQVLPDEDYGELITREDGSPIFYFGGTNLTSATKAIWKVDNKIYALDPRRIHIPEETENIYENPDDQRTTKNLGARPKSKTQQEQLMQKTEEPSYLTEQINIIKEDISEIMKIKQDISDMVKTMNAKSRSVSRHVSPVRNSSRSRQSSRNVSPIRNREFNFEENEDYLDYNQKQLHSNQIKQESTEERFSRFLIQKSKLVNHLTQLQHKQGPSYALWLQTLKDEMKIFAMPEEFFVLLAIRKIPEEIRSDVIAKKVKTPKELNEALYSIYCETRNAISLKTQFFKENKMAPTDRNYNNLRTTIKRTQAPMIVSVERIGYNDIPSIRERLVEETSERISMELFISAIQDDCKRSILNKGRYNSLDELVSRANDFASSISDETHRTRIGHIADKQNSPDHCKIHPHGIHNQSQCRLKCLKHPNSDHKMSTCPNKTVDFRSSTTQIGTCHPSRVGLHAEPLWCLFCNTVTPKMENHRCFHCWKCSNQTTPLLGKDCPCPNRFKK